MHFLSHVFALRFGVINDKRNASNKPNKSTGRLNFAIVQGDRPIVRKTNDN